MFWQNHCKGKSSGTCKRFYRIAQGITTMTSNCKTMPWHDKQWTIRSRPMFHHGSVLENIQKRDTLAGALLRPPKMYQYILGEKWDTLAMSFTLARLCGDWRLVSRNYKARGASGRKYKDQIVIFRILAAVNRFSRISWKAENHWRKLENRWRKEKAVEENQKAVEENRILCEENWSLGEGKSQFSQEIL